MLIKRFMSGWDYDKTLKLRQLWCAAMVAVGLVGFICYALFVPNSSLSDHAQGFYLGAATGLFVGGLVLLWKTRRVMHNPEAKRKARIEETDERRSLILSKACVFAGLFTFFCGGAALFVVLPFSMEAYYALLAMMLLYTLGLVLSVFWLSKHI